MKPIKIERRNPIRPHRKRQGVPWYERAEVWTVAKYAALTLAGTMLFRAGQARGLIDHGYAAVGGEVFALFLPAYYFIISKLARDVLADKQGNSKNN